jgi:hypothetical protein
MYESFIYIRYNCVYRLWTNDSQMEDYEIGVKYDFKRIPRNGGCLYKIFI